MYPISPPTSLRAEVSSVTGAKPSLFADYILVQSVSLPGRASARALLLLPLSR